MTQQSGAGPASDHPEQPRQTQMVEQTSKPVKPAKSHKPAKNLYEPYDTPMWLWIVLRAVARFLFFLKLNVHLVGLNNVPKQGAFIIASNHLSWMDVPLVPCYLKRKVVYMAKEELFYGKAGWIIRLFGAFPVKRGEADRQSLRVADMQLKAGKIFMIFPEGTRSKIQQLGRGHVGTGMIALRARVPVVPVAIWGSEYTFKKLRPDVTISYGEPVLLTPRGKKITREDIEDATNEVMRRIAAMMPPSYRGMYGDMPASSSDETVQREL
ncbi:MAG TPA: lysophospholipid acyltransferase family protein [Ktedonobacteraceae bacterium]|nr:lysophospholipid acyltransferase family protein [Ktedonobacteraceae bacterium]